MKVVFSTAAYAGLLVETQEKIRTETGGVFLGCFNDDVWYIIETIDPGPKSIFRVDYFEYDQPYITHLINKRARLYKTKLSLVGLWHRHPGSFDIFSTTDDGTNAKYSLISPHGALSMLVNIDPVFRLSVFHVSSRGNQRPSYKLIDYEVGDEKIPKEFLERKNIPDLQASIDHYGIKSAGLYEYMRIAVRQLEAVPVISSESENSNIIYLHEHTSQASIDGTKEHLIDLTLEPIDYLSNQIRFSISVTWNADMMDLFENTGDSKRYVCRFKYLPSFGCAGLEFENQTYFCKKDMFCSDTLHIHPSGTMRRNSSYYDSTNNTQIGFNMDTSDIERTYSDIRNKLYDFFKSLIIDNDKEG